MPLYFLRFIFLSIGFVLISNGLFAQMRTGFHYRYGHLFKHSKEIDPRLAGLIARGGEVFFHFPTKGEKPWQHVYGLPEVGVSLHWWDLGASDILGNAYTATVYLQFFPIRSPRHELSFKICPGLLYATKPYDQEENPLNIYYSTRLNSVMEGNLLYHYRISPHFKFSTGVSITHASNGAFNLPNKGMNIFAANVGLIYQLAPESQNLQVTKADSLHEFHYDKKWKTNIRFTAASRKADLDDLDRDIALSLSLLMHKRLNRRSALNLGVDVFYNESIRDRVGENAVLYRTAISAGHELVINKVSFQTDVGVYVYKPEAVDRRVFQRYGLRYRFHPNLFAYWGLKAHLGRADVLELGIGIRVW